MLCLHLPTRMSEWINEKQDREWVRLVETTTTKKNIFASSQTFVVSSMLLICMRGTQEGIL